MPFWVRVGRGFSGPRASGPRARAFGFGGGRGPPSLASFPGASFGHHAGVTSQPPANPPGPVPARRTRTRTRQSRQTTFRHTRLTFKRRCCCGNHHRRHPSPASALCSPPPGRVPSRRCPRLRPRSTTHGGSGALIWWSQKHVSAP